MGPRLQNTLGPMSFRTTLRKNSQGRVLGLPKICEWRRLGSTRVSQSRAIGQTWQRAKEWKVASHTRKFPRYHDQQWTVSTEDAEHTEAGTTVMLYPLLTVG